MGRSTHKRKRCRENSACYSACEEDLVGGLYGCKVGIDMLTDHLCMNISCNRDLGTEGASGADIQLRKCLSGASPLIPGPRYFCSDRAIVCTGSYGSCTRFCLAGIANLALVTGPKSAIHVHQEGIQGITGAEVADGKEECTKAVRRQIGAGADWIKVR